MGKKLKKVKDNKKFEVYENEEYKVKISDINGFFTRKMALIILIMTQIRMMMIINLWRQ